ncbi:hypothetical protein DPMN_043462 [Dreissena polymorpha]|uniref:Uncharacterized protein n=1 Tax=Dreissena polymorpha TaxID=45954 RepID=A0A9D4D2E6_DREPO|nr:hypothetical protein DPMN_043462 [Dreissena polymorpha]
MLLQCMHPWLILLIRKEEEFRCRIRHLDTDLKETVSTTAVAAVAVREAEQSTTDESESSVNLLKAPPLTRNVNTMVAAVYGSKWYVRKVEEFDTDDNEYRIQFMVKAKEIYKWPQYSDWVWISANEIFYVVKTLTASWKSNRLFKLDGEENMQIEQLFQNRYAKS